MTSSHQNRIHIRIVGDGYLINPDYPTVCQKIPFGEIVRENMNVYHNKQAGVPLERLVSSNPASLSYKVAALKRACNSVKAGNFIAKLDESIKYLPLLMEDREGFLNLFSSNMSQLFSKPIEVKNVWDTKEKKIVQELYIIDLKDILLYDIEMVIEKDIYIRPCAYCGEYFIQKRKQEKYCPNHRKIGQDTTRINNFNTDPCRRLEKKIYNRLRNRIGGQVVAASSQYVWGDLDRYTVELADVKAKYKSGAITQEEYLSWLSGQEIRTRIYKRDQTKRSET